MFVSLNFFKKSLLQADLLDILNEFDQARSGGINFKQFLKFMTENQDNIDRKEELRRSVASNTLFLFKTLRLVQFYHKIILNLA